MKLRVRRDLFDSDQVTHSKGSKFRFSFFSLVPGLIQEVVLRLSRTGAHVHLGSEYEST
jgi:hypothetical protein